MNKPKAKSKVKSEKAKATYAKLFNFLLFTLSTLCLCISAVKIQAQSGGGFDLSHNVIASGGGSSSNGAFRVDGTIGQGIAGTTSTGSPFAVTGGFWTPRPLGSTAAPVSISGAVRTAYGRGIRGAYVTLTSLNGDIRATYTNAFGYFRFLGVGSGESYVLSVSARRYHFDEPSRAVNVMSQITGADFVASSQ